MFKRTIAALLSIIMFTMSSMVVFAANGAYDLTFDISSGGENEITVKQGDIITVDFYMKRTDDAASFNLNSYQNEIEYDKDFFTLIVPDEWNFRYTPDPNDDVSDERISTGQKIVMITETNVKGLESEAWIGSFQLKVTGEKGTSSIVRSSEAYASNSNRVQCNLSFTNLKVNVAEIYDVSYSNDVFDSTETETKAYKGIDYTGKILDSVYDDLYIWTVSYEIGGVTKYISCDDGAFTIPGSDITGDIKLDYSKELNIKVYAEPYAPGLTLIRVEGAGDGYTFDGNKMIKAANSENMGAWIVEGDLTAEEAKGLVGVADDASDTITESTDVSGDGKTNLNDLAIVLGCSKGYYESSNAEEVTRYLLSDVNGDRQVTESDYEDIVNAYKRNK